MDNAATSFPKPPAVSAAVSEFLDRYCGSAGRGAYREAIDTSRMFDRCRSALRTLLGATDDDVIAFTLNGTDALNLAIKGVLNEGDHAVTTCFDHNSVLRPLEALRIRRRIGFDVVDSANESGEIDPGAIATAIRPSTKLVIVNHVSNVTGAIQPIDDIGRICRERRILMLVDAAQSAGHLPIHFSDAPFDLLATPGHKGLLGPLGTGVLLMRGSIAQHIASLREGGTGSMSEHPVQPEFAPDKFEAGSQNGVGISGLNAAVEWILERGVGSIRDHELALCERFLSRIDGCPGLTLFGPRDAQRRAGVFSVRVDGIDPPELSALLENRFGILTRSGLHCAPLAHAKMGTRVTGGTTRLSLGPFLGNADVDAAVGALTEIAKAFAAPPR